MDTHTSLILAPGAARRPNSERFDRVSVALHWLTVLLVVWQFATIRLLHLNFGHEPLLLALHRSAGMLALLVMVARLAWRLCFADLPPFPASMSKAQQGAAKLT
jgi:cytochrome b561